MKKKRVIAIIAAGMAVVLGIFCYANRPVSIEGEIGETAVSRELTEKDEGITYIDDEAVGLANSVISADPAQGNYREEAQKAFQRINDLRAEQGLAPLAWSSELESTSSVRVVEATQSFSHTRPDGSDWWTVNSNVMYGENLARGYNTAADAVSGWMASPTHAANIMKADFKTMAISVYQGSDGKWYWAQEFGY